MAGGGKGKGEGKAGGRRSRRKFVEKALVGRIFSIFLIYYEECHKQQRARRAAHIYFDGTAQKSRTTYTPVEQPTDPCMDPECRRQGPSAC